MESQNLGAALTGYEHRDFHAVRTIREYGSTPPSSDIPARWQSGVAFVGAVTLECRGSGPRSSKARTRDPRAAFLLTRSWMARSPRSSSSSSAAAAGERKIWPPSAARITPHNGSSPGLTSDSCLSGVNATLIGRRRACAATHESRRRAGALPRMPPFSLWERPRSRCLERPRVEVLHTFHRVAE